jgi:exodeoxyribonuclease V gamma subunit
LVAMHPEQKDFRKTFILQHPLQVFSGDDSEDPRRLRFDPAWQAPPETGLKKDIHFFQTPIVDNAVNLPDTIVQWQELKRFFKHPTKYFLQTQLGLRLSAQEEKLDEHEPFGNPSGLQRYQLRHAVFNALIADERMPSDADLLTHLRSLALLPSGFSAESILHKTLSEVKLQALRFKAWRLGQAGILPFELKLGRFIVQGQLDGIYENGAARIVLGEMQGRHHCLHGLDALLLSALGNKIPLVEFAQIKKDQPVQRIRPMQENAAAIQQLNELLELFFDGQKHPLPFYPDTSFAYIKNLHGQAFAFNEKAWEKASDAAPEQDVWWATAMRGRDPFIDHADQPETFPSSIAFRDISFEVFSACAPEFIGGEDNADD